MIRLAERTYLEAGRLARDERAVVILPLGAVEQHGPHLPLLVDWLGAEELARHVAPHLERAGYRVILAPALPYGASPLALTWPGTISLSRATLRRVIVDVVRSLARHGFRRFVLANYQADPGQLRAMAEAKRALRLRGRLMAREIIRAFGDGRPAAAGGPARGWARRRVRKAGLRATGRSRPSGTRRSRGSASPATSHRAARR
jgi:creatinine amidohydrolase/Fe(II)-dependent formamide hydrolase-like protein